ncbi:MAG TPA: protein kinase [Gemmatimonadales bacterium]|nr:protein kinase [Gemmatimonadales bacterium]
MERELGRGGMATVYLARDSKLNRLVAIKVLRPELSDLLGRERFLREIEIAAGLQHANILPLYDSGATDSLLYYVMPYVEGETLRDRLEREKQLPLEDALQVAREVAEALSYAHSLGLVHRDIKPANILLSGGHALVADFGIARAITAAGGEQLTERGIAVGTPAYMSPEQGSGQDPIDGRSDVYALGCVLYEMLAGDPPFSGRTAQAIIARHLQERPPSLRVVRPTVTLGVQRVIETALAKIPADRYATGTQLIAALEAALRGRADWRRRLARIAALIVVLGGAATFWRFVLARTRTLDSNKVVVFPLVERGGQGAGERVALMIGSALEHTEPLKWIDGWTWLNPLERADIARLTAETARRIARHQGARYYIDGSVVAEQDTATVILRLNDVEGDSTVARVSASGPLLGTSLPQLGLQSVNRLLPQLLAPNRRVDLRALAERRPAAVASWLEGEREHRRSQFANALTYYQRALGEDSNLAVAALKGAQAASWIGQLDEAERLAGVALGNQRFLSSRETLLARGLASYLIGAADTAVAWLSRAVGANPDWSEAQMALGEVFYHLLPDTAPLDSLAASAFLHAAELDSDFTPPVFHLAEMALRRGDAVEGARLVERFRRSRPDSLVLRQLTLMLDCVRQGPNERAWRTAGQLDPNIALQAARSLSASGQEAACAEAGYRVVLANPRASALHWGTFLGLNDLLAAQGRTEEIVALVDSLTAAGFGTAAMVYPIVALAGAPALRSKVEDFVAWLRETNGQAYEDSISPSSQLQLGTWFARTERVDQATHLHTKLVRQARNTRDPEVAQYANALAAHIALAHGDSALALSLLETLRPVARRGTLEWGFTQALPVERLTLAQLLLARGRYGEANGVASAFDHSTPIFYLPFLAASLAVRYRAARSLGQSRQASWYRDRLLALGRGDLIDAHD